MSEDGIRHIFEVQERSRKKVRVGDVFTMRLIDDGGWLFGRVVSTEARSGRFSDPHSLLLYFYEDIHESPDDVPNEAFSPPRLLISPKLTNAMGWRHGYFQTISNVPLSAEELVSQHVFYQSSRRDEFWNEHAQRVFPPFDIDYTPDMFALDSYVTIEAAIADALGFPPVIIDD